MQTLHNSETRSSAFCNFIPTLTVSPALKSGISLLMRRFVLPLFVRSYPSQISFNHGFSVLLIHRSRALIFLGSLTLLSPKEYTTKFFSVDFIPINQRCNIINPHRQSDIFKRVGQRLN